MMCGTRWDLVDAQRARCTWNHRGGHLEIKLKMDGSMRWAVSALLPLLCRFHCIRS
jgi:hypothetical protein